jgi:hypothetical protein
MGNIKLPLTNATSHVAKPTPFAIEMQFPSHLLQSEMQDVAQILVS